ncbi:DUF899 domain-containing protein [Parvibaculaceae bacterium PLY_AMNH_Bact1]|nr:DUF899 domain-containing protein [Parvibaculaceae bacterium PLY_AMNH_Bact1]
MAHNKAVSRDEWVSARKELLEEEKSFSKARDALAAKRRELPWTKIDKTYEFETEQGLKSLGDLFDGRSQLIIQHFMFGPDWEEGCPSCSFWGDNFNQTVPHLAARDVAFVAVSRAPLQTLLDYRDRLGWSFPWASSLANDFNFDFDVSFAPDRAPDQPVYYNYHDTVFPASEAPGVSVFYKNDEDEIYHTYSVFARGLEDLNGTYRLLDTTPKGRDEDALSYPMEWVRRRDQY